MKKQILNLGKGLSKAEQKVIHGGYFGQDDCPEHECNVHGKTCEAGNECRAFNWSETCPEGETLRYICFPES